MIGLSRGVLLLFIVGMLGIAYLDYSTGENLAVWGLYLLPVGIASWMGGFRSGIVLSLVSCVFIFVAGFYGGNMFASTGYFVLGIFNRFFAFILVAWLASYLYRKQMLESTLQSYEEYMDYLHASPNQEGGSDASASASKAPDQGSPSTLDQGR